MKSKIKELAGDQNYIKILRLIVKARQEFVQIMNEARIKSKTK